MTSTTTHEKSTTKRGPWSKARGLGQKALAAIRHQSTTTQTMLGIEGSNLNDSLSGAELLRARAEYLRITRRHTLPTPKAGTNTRYGRTPDGMPVTALYGKNGALESLTFRTGVDNAKPALVRDITYGIDALGNPQIVVRNGELFQDQYGRPKFVETDESKEHPQSYAADDTAMVALENNLQTVRWGAGEVVRHEDYL